LTSLAPKYYRTVREVRGPLLIVEKTKEVGYGEIVRVIDPKGEERNGSVIETGEGYAIVQVFEGTSEIDADRTAVTFLGDTLKIPVSQDIVGRVLNGRGEFIDGEPPVVPDDYLDVNGLPINPTAREYPKDFMQTGISAIDGMNTLSQGQKLPLFTGSGLPHNQLAMQIARQAKVPGKEEEFVVVFGAMGISYEDYKFFVNNFERTGALSRSVLIVNLADDPVAERIFAPRLAMTYAEYLAFTLGMHVLVILTDMLSYAEGLREISAAREEMPGRRGFPGYLYTDLASIYERCGRILGRKGSVTLIPIVTMPNDDITHPVVDLTGYITEGQIFLDRNLHNKGIYPPINVLPSLSRLMTEATRYTREDHRDLSNQLYAAYARAQEVRNLALIIGEEALEESERRYLDFGNAFERRFINQGFEENRDLDYTLDLGWELLAEYVPEEDLTRIPRKIIEKYHPKYRHKGVVESEKSS